MQRDNAVSSSLPPWLETSPAHLFIFKCHTFIFNKVYHMSPDLPGGDMPFLGN